MAIHRMVRSIKKGSVPAPKAANDYTYYSHLTLPGNLSEVSSLILLAPFAAGHAARLVDRQYRCDEQHEHGDASGDHELESHAAKITSRHGGFRRGASHEPDRLEVDPQGTGGGHR